MRTPAKVLSSLFGLAIVLSATVPAYAEPASAGQLADTRFGVAEGFRNPGVMADIGAGWERLVLPWDQIQPGKAGDFGHLGQTLTRTQVQGELSRGTHMAGLLQFSGLRQDRVLPDGRRRRLRHARADSEEWRERAGGRSTR
jgi:hypothetical protein